VLNGGGGDEGIWYFQTVALREFAQQRSGQLPNFIIRGDADEGAEKDRNKRVFVRMGASPDFGSDNRGAENNGSSGDQRGPFRGNLRVPCTENLDGYVGVEEYGHTMPSRFRRVPLRRLRT